MAVLALPRDLIWYAGLACVGVAVGLLAGVNPTLAIIAALGVVFVFLVMADITLGLSVFVVVAFVGFLPGGGGVAVGLTKIIGLLLAISWFALMTTRREARIDFFAGQPALTYLLVLFLAWAGLSLFWAESSEAGATSIFRYSLNLMLFPIVYTAVQTPRHVIWISGSFVAGAAAAAAMGLLTPSADPLLAGRLQGAVLDPNQLAAVLVAGMALASALAMVLRRSPGRALLAAMAALLCMAGIVLTLSRGGLLAAAVAVAFAPLVAGRWRGIVTAGAVGAVISIVMFFAAFAPEAGKDRVTTLGSGTGRSDIWKIGWRMVEDKPVYGVGVGNFQVSSIHYLVKPGLIQYDYFFVQRPKVAHNTYLQVLAELGIVGLAIFAAILAFFFRSALSAARAFRRCRNVSMEIMSRALMVAVVGLLTADFFISGQFTKQLWLLLALGPAMLGVARSLERTARPGTDH